MGRARALYTFVLENFGTRFSFKKCCSKFPVFEQILLIFVSNVLLFIGNFKTEIFKILFCCKHLLSTIILHLTGLCPKTVIVSDFSGDISIKNFFDMFYNVSTPLCKLPSESAIMT